MFVQPKQLRPARRISVGGSLTSGCRRLRRRPSVRREQIPTCRIKEGVAAAHLNPGAAGGGGGDEGGQVGGGEEEEEEKVDEEVGG